MSRWRTEATSVACMTCDWSASPQLRDKLAAGRRHKIKHPSHVVIASREQALTIEARRRS